MVDEVFENASIRIAHRVGSFLRYAGGSVTWYVRARPGMRIPL